MVTTIFCCSFFYGPGIKYVYFCRTSYVVRLKKNEQTTNIILKRLNVSKFVEFFYRRFTQFNAGYYWCKNTKKAGFLRPALYNLRFNVGHLLLLVALLQSQQNYLILIPKSLSKNLILS